MNANIWIWARVDKIYGKATARKDRFSVFTIDRVPTELYLIFFCFIWLYYMLGGNAYGNHYWFTSNTSTSKADKLIFKMQSIKATYLPLLLIDSIKIKPIQFKYKKSN